jgi:hypothetical protein
MNIEHIYIGDEIADQPTEPTNISRQDTITNRVNGTSTEFTLYEEGFIKVREIRNGKNSREKLLELQFLDPSPILTRHTATAFLWSSLGFGGLALVASAVLPMTGLSQYAFSASAIVATLAVLNLFLFIYRSEVKHQFRTASGQAIVLTLTGSFGCIRRMQAIANHVRKAIADTSDKADTHDARYLRAEIQAHYKLAETGVITREACSSGTFLILSKLG